MESSSHLFLMRLSFAALVAICGCGGCGHGGGRRELWLHERLDASCLCDLTIQNSYDFSLLLNTNIIRSCFFSWIIFFSFFLKGLFE